MTINLPYGPGDTNENALPEGTHRVTVKSIKLVHTKSTAEPKLVVEYGNADGTFADFLGFGSPAQAKRTFAYTCRLHELAGLIPPKGSDFDETALLGIACQILLVTNDRGYIQLGDFPSAAMAEDDIAF